MSFRRMLQMPEFWHLLANYREALARRAILILSKWVT